ncbi:MAG: BTAD domain-containing putative transcriptional regulator [Candidatus Bipolaricaulia bacterium]
MGQTQMDDFGLRVKLLGHFEIWRGHELIPPQAWPQRKTQTLLKILLTERGRVFTQDQLIDALFPDLDLDKAARSLRGRISELRRTLEPDLKRGPDSQFVLRVGGGYCFSENAPCWIDVEEFHQSMESARELEQAELWSQALEQYQQTVELYRGDYLAEDLYEEWSIPPRERWRELYLNALGRLAECYARLRNYPRAIEYCQRMIELDPYREAGYRQQMLYHSYAGERRKALQVYETCVKVLKDELDAKPAPETYELYQQIRNGEVPELPRAIPNNLPIPLTRFIGREKELNAVQKHLLDEDVRLLTLTGVGGTGKTRLGLQVAADLIAHFEDGAYFMNLAPISDPGLVVSTIAQTLGIKETGGQSLFDSLKESLRDRQILLLLDNFEPVVAAAPQVVGLLEAYPRLKLLVTSREPCHVSGEHVFPVPPLTLPKSDLKPPPPIEHLVQYEAVRLFIERALAVKLDFAVTRESAPAIAEICIRLDGLPLAIELAAARITLLSPQAILERLGSRLELLTGGARDLPARQQTLRDTIDWSYDLLDAGEKTLFERLSVFVGGCTLEAAEAVCSGVDDLEQEMDILDGLASLVDKNLLRQEERAEGEPRFLMLETIREYGLERLEASGKTEAEAIRCTHADYYLDLAEAAEPRIGWWGGPEQGIWLNWLEVEHDNLRAALAHFEQIGEVEAGLRLGGALRSFWFLRGSPSEGRRWLEGALKQGGSVSAPVRAKALLGAGWLAWRQSDYEQATALLEESLALFQELGDKEGIAGSLNRLGLVACSEGDLGRAAALCEEALTLYRELGDKLGIADSILYLGHVAQYQDDLGRATALYEESLVLCRGLENKQGIALSLFHLGNVAVGQGDLGRAVALYEESLILRQEIGDKGGIALCLEGLAGVACANGQPEQAARLFGAAEALREAIGFPLMPPDRTLLDYDRNVAAVRAELSEDAFEAAWTEGRAMTLEQAIAYALEEAAQKR